MSRGTSTPGAAQTKQSALRSRWAAVGAAVAVTIGVGGVGLVEATVDSGDRPVLVQIEPCRLLDTRALLGSDNAIGGGVGEIYTVQAHGVTGDCDLPTAATGLSLNVTAIQPSQRTNIRIFPDASNVPLASSLNPEPGQPPTPNAVTTVLAEDGSFSIFNEFGSLDLVIDVNGYYEDHNHDDRYVEQTDLMWAVVGAGGELVRRSPGVTSSQKMDNGVPIGDYVVLFDRDISQCAYQATVGRPGFNVMPEPGYAQVANWIDDPTSGVAVFTRDQDGAGTETRGFHLTVFCGAEFDPPIGI